MDKQHTLTGADDGRAGGTRGFALVTGGNTGIGKEIARQLVGAGFTVYVGSRDAERGRAAVEELGGSARLLVLDVTDQQSIAAAAAAVSDLDVLVNNAGISDARQHSTETEVATLRRVYETNVFGVVAITNAFLPTLRRSLAPHIVNVSSGTGSLAWSTGPNPQFDYQRLAGAGAAYRSSKAALNALTIYYAQALATRASRSTPSRQACAPPTSTVKPLSSAGTRRRRPPEP